METKRTEYDIPYFIEAKRSVDDLLDEGKTFKEINDYYNEYEKRIQEIAEKGTYYIIEDFFTKERKRL